MKGHLSNVNAIDAHTLVFIKYSQSKDTTQRYGQKTLNERPFIVCYIGQRTLTLSYTVTIKDIAN